MLIPALIFLAVSPFQDGGFPPGDGLYAPPAVRPFEPPSTFGRIEAEGDGGGDTRRAPIAAPVAVEDYRRSYEFAPTGADTAYDRGVSEAERTMDQRMGPLDGGWRVADGDGRVLMALLLSDPGGGRPVAGGWRVQDAVATLGPLRETGRDGGTIVLALEGATLTLRAEGNGWSGTLQADGRDRAVTLVR